MIACSAACYEALLHKPVRLRPKAMWNLSRGATADGIDISRRVTNWGTWAQIVPPFLGNATIADTSIVLENTDGLFTVRSATGYLPDGPKSYYGTPITVTQEVELADGTLEEIPVYEGLVQYVIPTEGQLEVKLAGRMGVLAQTLLPEEVAIGGIDASGICKGLSDAFSDLLAFTPIDYPGDVGTSITSEAALVMKRGGWTLGGAVSDRTTVGGALQELCRSTLHALVDGEDGKLRAVPLVLPRETGPGSLALDDINLTETFETPLAFDFSIDEGIQTVVTEATVRYFGGATARYRDSDAEATIGRRVLPPVSMEFLRMGAQAQWAARMLYEFHADFPMTVRFLAPAIGLLAQIGDVARVHDTVTDVQREFVVTGKGWANPGMVTLIGRTNAARDTIFEADQAHYSVDSWGATIL